MRDPGNEVANFLFQISVKKMALLKVCNLLRVLFQFSLPREVFDKIDKL